MNPKSKVQIAFLGRGCFWPFFSGKCSQLNYCTDPWIKDGVCLNNFISPNFCNRNKKNYVPLFLLKSILLFHNWCSCQFSSPLLLSHGHSTRQLDPSKLLIRIDQSAVRRQWSSIWIEKKTHSHNQTIFLVVCHCNDKVNKWNELRQNPKS